MKNQIRLKKTDCRRYSGIFQYLVSYDPVEKSPDCYTLFVLNKDDPVILADAVSLTTCREIIRVFENLGKTVQDEYEGSREVVLEVLGMLEIVARLQNPSDLPKDQAEYEAAHLRAWDCGDRTFRLDYPTAQVWQDRFSGLLVNGVFDADKFDGLDEEV